MSDVIPSIHASHSKSRVFDWRAMLLLAGVLVVGTLINIAHSYIDPHHDEPGHSHIHENSHEHDHDDHDDYQYEHDHYDDQSYED